MMQIKRNKSLTKYVAILAGLGYDQNTLEPMYGQHDLVLNLDVELDKDDFKLVNQLRYSMNVILCTDRGPDGRPNVTPSTICDLQATLKKIIIKKYIETHTSGNANVWERFEREEILETKEVFGERSIFPMLPSMRLYSEDYGPILNDSNTPSTSSKCFDQNFTKVSQSDEFLALDFDELIDLIKRDELNVICEEVIFKACMKWLKYGEEKRVSMFPQVLAQNRKKIAFINYQKSNFKRKHIHSIMFRFSRMRQRGEFTSGQVSAVGGLASNGESVSTVEIYDPYERRWRMGEQMSMLKLAYNFYTQVDLTSMFCRSRVSVAIMDGKWMYVFGGFNCSERLSTVEVYDPRENILNFINKCIHSRI
uniref:BACK domain-containing protein n=1 Tax=Glossina morsitans morsitans TaxID=37546 RepID=A0A1B0GED8_GLOMM